MNKYREMKYRIKEIQLSTNVNLSSDGIVPYDHYSAYKALKEGNAVYFYSDELGKKYVGFMSRNFFPRDPFGTNIARDQKGNYLGEDSELSYALKFLGINYASSNPGYMSFDEPKK